MLLDGGCLSSRRSMGLSKTMSVYKTSWTLSRPAVIYVQPRERLTNFNCKLPAHNSINISPDFSLFTGSTEKSPNLERTPNNSCSSTPPLPPRIPKYVDYEEVLKQIEEDRPQNGKVQNVSAPELPPLAEQEEIVNDDISEEEEFIDVPLQNLDEKCDERKTDSDDTKILSKFIDRLLVDVYPNICKCGACKYCDNISRRRSDSKLFEITRTKKEPLVRHHSYCLGLEGAERYYRLNKVTEVEGFKRSHPFYYQKVTASAHLVQPYTEQDLINLETKEFCNIITSLSMHIDVLASDLRNVLDIKEKYLSEQEDMCETLTAILQAMSTKTSSELFHSLQSFRSKYTQFLQPSYITNLE